MRLLYENRSVQDQKFIRKVCNYILDQPIEEKEKSDQFCGIYVEGRDRDINTSEDFASLYSFKCFSRYDYPIYVFCRSNKNWMNGDFATISRVNFIQIPPLNSLDEYTNFCTKELYHKISKDIKYAVTLQPDAALLRNGWEDEFLKNNWVYLGSPWTHAPSIEYQDNDGEWKDFLGPVRVGNGGFSIRDVNFCRAASIYYGNYKLREKFAPNNKIPPEDLFYSTIAKYLDGNMPTVEQASQFCCDPLTPEIFNSNNKPFGFHYYSSG